MTSTALLSDDGRYRYHLARRWADGPLLTWVMLNPSTADARLDDLTIKRCKGFAHREGFAGIEVINLYAMRATLPDMLVAKDAEGPDNLATWERVLGEATMVVAAWGGFLASRRDRLPDPTLVAWARDHPGWWEGWYCLGRTQQGAPRHPSRLAVGTPLVPYVPDEERCTRDDWT